MQTHDIFLALFEVWGSTKRGQFLAQRHLDPPPRDDDLLDLKVARIDVHPQWMHRCDESKYPNIELPAKGTLIKGYLLILKILWVVEKESLLKK